MALGMSETLSIGLGVIVLNGVLWSHSCWMSAIVCIRCLYDMVCIFTQGREKNFWNVFWKFFNEVHMNNTHSASRCKQLVLKLRMQRPFWLCTRSCGWHSFMSKNECVLNLTMNKLKQWVRFKFHIYLAQVTKPYLKHTFGLGLSS